MTQTPTPSRSLEAWGPCRRCGQPTTHLAKWRRAEGKNGTLQVLPVCETHARAVVLEEDPPYSLEPVRRTSASSSAPPAPPAPEMFPGVGPLT